MKEIFEQNSKYIACWSAGSGIPSTLSLMQYCLDNELDTKVVAFDSNKTQADIIYHEKIKDTVSKSDNFTEGYRLFGWDVGVRIQSNEMLVSFSSSHSPGNLWSVKSGIGYSF